MADWLIGLVQRLAKKGADAIYILPLSGRVRGERLSPLLTSPGRRGIIAHLLTGRCPKPFCHSAQQPQKDLTTFAECVRIIMGKEEF
jgi:hypothetical protein